MGICIAIPLAKAALDVHVHQVKSISTIGFIVNLQKVTWNYFAQFLTLPKVGPGPGLLFTRGTFGMTSPR